MTLCFVSWMLENKKELINLQHETFHKLEKKIVKMRSIPSKSYTEGIK